MSLKCAFRHSIERTIDIIYGVDTRYSNDELSQPCLLNADITGTSPLTYLSIWYYLSKANLGQDDIVIDIGCGAGRFLSCLARRRIKEVRGIEIDHALAARADQNMRSLRHVKSKWTIAVSDAQQADYRGANVFIMFNPFKSCTLRNVIQKIHADCIQNRADGIKIKIIYINPYYEKEMFDVPWLRRYRVVKMPGSNTWASFWRSV